MPSQGANFDWIDTPDPRERAFVITAKEGVSDTIPDFLNTTVLWSDCPKWIKNAETLPQSLQGYRLIHAQKAGYQKRSFYFGKVRTAEERALPFKQKWNKRPFSWPTVLLKLWAEQGRIPLSAVNESGEISSTESTLTRKRYRPGAMYPTWFRIRHFLSETAWPRYSSQQVPITDAIHWDFDGFSGGFGDCLHGDVTIPNDSTTGIVVPGFGTNSDLIGEDIVNQFYPATPMEDWQKYVLEDTRNDILGTMQERILVEVLPPNDMRENVG